MKETFLSKNKLRWLWYLSAIAALCLISVILYPSIVFSDTLYIVCVYIVVDAFVLVVVLRILREHNKLAFWKLIVYLFVVVAGSFFISFLLSPIENIMLFAPIVFTLLAFFNFALSKIIFTINVSKACLIGMLIGLINTLISIITTPVCE